jgi:predicted nucleic acid-binding protein
MAVVVDASVALAWCLPDEASASAEAVIAELGVEPGLVPPIFGYEVSNGLVLARRSGRLSEGAAAAAQRLITQLPVTLTGAGQDQGTIIDLASRHRLTSYDASYLSAAEHLGATLATLDGGLRKAAKKAGVRLLP